jgi:hypothetical protein
LRIAPSLTTATTSREIRYDAVTLRIEPSFETYNKVAIKPPLKTYNIVVANI